MLKGKKKREQIKTSLGKARTTPARRGQRFPCAVLLGEHESYGASYDNDDPGSRTRPQGSLPSNKGGLGGAKEKGDKGKKRTASSKPVFRLLKSSSEKSRVERGSGRGRNSEVCVFAIHSLRGKATIRETKRGE